MRVSNNYIMNSYVSKLNSNYEEQMKMMETSDGSNLHRPSDDEIHYSKYLRYQNANTENIQYNTNVKNGVSWMKTANSALESITSLESTIVEKSNQAATDTNTDMNFVEISREVLGEIQQIVSLCNTQQGDRYMFSGQRDLVEPFNFKPDDNGNIFDENNNLLLWDRGLTKTLSDAQKVFFNDVDDNGNMTQMLVLEGEEEIDASGNPIRKEYFLNTLTGDIYTKDFVEEGYKECETLEQEKVNPSQDRFAALGSEGTNDWSDSTDISTYFDKYGVITDAGKSKTFTVKDADGNDVNLTFKTIAQPIVIYNGDTNYISMVKRNGYIAPAEDTVNATGQDIFGADIFDNIKSGNSLEVNGGQFSSGAAALNDLLTVYAKMRDADPHWMSSDGVTIADQAHRVTVDAQTSVAARQNVYESMDSLLTTQNEYIQSDINDVSATDVAKLAVDLMASQALYNMALGMGARILPTTLVDYLG